MVTHAASNHGRCFYFCVYPLFLFVWPKFTLQSCFLGYPSTLHFANNLFGTALASLIQCFVWGKKNLDCFELVSHSEAATLKQLQCIEVPAPLCLHLEDLSMCFMLRWRKSEKHLHMSSSQREEGLSWKFQCSLESVAWITQMDPAFLSEVDFYPRTVLHCFLRS